MRQTIKKGKITLPLQPETLLQQLCEHDYARSVAVVLANRDSYLGREFDVASTELSMHHVCEIISHVLGRTIVYEQISWNQAEQQLGEEMTTMYRWFESHGYEADLEAVRTNFGPTTSLDAYLREQPFANLVASS